MNPETVRLAAKGPVQHDGNLLRHSLLGGWPGHGVGQSFQGAPAGKEADIAIPGSEGLSCRVRRLEGGAFDISDCGHIFSRLEGLSPGVTRNPALLAALERTLVKAGISLNGGWIESKAVRVEDLSSAVRGLSACLQDLDNALERVKLLGLHQPFHDEALLVAVSNPQGISAPLRYNHFADKYELALHLVGAMFGEPIETTMAERNRPIPWLGVSRLQLSHSLAREWADGMIGTGLLDAAVDRARLPRSEANAPEQFSAGDLAHIATLATTLEGAPAVLGAAGEAGSGKDTAAAILGHAAGYRRLAFADAIKDALCVLLNEDRAYFDAHKDKPVAWLGVTRRALMQTFGTDWGRRKVDSNLWIRLLEEKVKALRAGERVFISDIRYDNEADALRRVNGTLLHLVRASKEIEANGVKGHSSESGIRRLPDEPVLQNDSTIQDYATAIALAVGRPVDAASGVQTPPPAKPRRALRP